MKKMENAKRTALLSLALLFAGCLNAKNTELHLRWQELPGSLVGQTVKVVQIGSNTLSGKVARIEPDDLILETRRGRKTILRANTLQIGMVRSLHRSRGKVIGTAVGAGVGMVAIAVALALRNNENGANSDTIVGAAAGLAIGTTVLGYLVGWESDRERTTIYIQK